MLTRRNAVFASLCVSSIGLATLLAGCGDSGSNQGTMPGGEVKIVAPPGGTTIQDEAKNAPVAPAK
jgi:hypothetical protein